MANRPIRRFYRFRRSVTPRDTVAAGLLERGLWGVSGASARTALANQATEFDAEERTADQMLQASRADAERLRQLVEHQRIRIQHLRRSIDTVRDKLDHERAARSVLAARLLDRQAEEQKLVSDAAQERMAGVRLSADIKEEHESLRQLVAVLYRSIAGRWNVPTDLDLLAQLPAPPAARQAHARTFGGRPAPGPGWHRFLMEKRSGVTLKAPDGRVIVEDGETIGPQNIADAEAAGMLFELIISMRMVERIPDL